MRSLRFYTYIYAERKLLFLSKMSHIGNDVARNVLIAFACLMSFVCYVLSLALLLGNVVLILLRKKYSVFTTLLLSMHRMDACFYGLQYTVLCFLSLLLSLLLCFILSVLLH